MNLNNAIKAARGMIESEKRSSVLIKRKSPDDYRYRPWGVISVEAPEKLVDDKKAQIGILIPDFDARYKLAFE